MTDPGAVALTEGRPDPFLAQVRTHHRLNELVQALPAAERAAWIAGLPGGDTLWALKARPEQLPPPDLGRTWIFMGGRGSGKTRALTASAHLAVQAGIRRLGIVAPTSTDIRDVVVGGEAGLLATAPAGLRPTFIETKRKVLWPNGAEALTFSAEEPESLRGPEFELVLIDELARMAYGPAVLDMADLCLRVGAYPRRLIATTPRPKGWFRSLVKAPGTHVTHATTWANAANLAPSFLENLKQTWQGRRLALQELEGLIVAEHDQELFKESWFLHDPVPPETIERVAVGVDPSGGADVIGIVAGARLADGRYAVLADRSLKGSPAQWSEAAIRVHDELAAEDLVVEVNYGGQMATDTIRQAAIRMAEQGRRESGFIRVREVVATRGKALRAEPISALYEQGKVLHRPGLAQLEAEMLNFTVGWDRSREGSPNRLDATVWSLSRLSRIIMDIPIA